MKKLIIFTFGALIIIAVAFWFLQPKNRNLRGSYKPSGDGKTYLAIADDNQGACHPLLVDGIEWKHKTGEVELISAGDHKIQCGESDSGIGFTIPEGTVFSFDYWGP